MLLFIFILLLSSMALAGVDFSMMGENSIPEFKSDLEAINWARGVKWIEPLLQELRNKRLDVIHEIARINSGESSSRIIELLNQWGHYNMAINIMEEYKKMDIKGASFYAGSEIIK